MHISAENSVANYNVEGPIIFQPGSSENDNSTQCFIVNITNDDIVEDTQVIILRLTVMSSGCAISGNSSSDGEVELTIFDDPADGKANSNIIYSLYLLHYYI